MNGNNVYFDKSIAEKLWSLEKRVLSLEKDVGILGDVVLKDDSLSEESSEEDDTVLHEKSPKQRYGT